MTEAALATRPISMKDPVNTKDTLEALITLPSFQKAVRDILPDHLKADRILKMALVAASRQPTLYKCTQGSIVQALMRSAELGLDCSGTLGLGYLVPYYNTAIKGYECQFIPGYRGIIELAKRANPKMQIEARVVYRQDVFEFEYGLDQKLVHKPTTGERGEIDYFYCISREMGLLPEFTVMTKEEVDMTMLRSKSRDRQGKIVGPWATDYAEMGRKTVTKRHAKYLSLAVEVHEAIATDNEQYNYSNNDVAVATAVAENSGAGIGAMKQRMSLVRDREPSDDADPDDAGLVDPAIAEAVFADAIDVEPLEELDELDQAIAADDAHDDDVQIREPHPDEITAAEAAELKLFELRKEAVTLFRRLEHEDHERYIAAVKWLGTKALTELDTRKLTEFFKKFE